MASRDEANEWIALKHTGENEGIGVVSWDGEETARFRGADPGYKLLDFVRSQASLSDAALEGMKRFPVTNLDRLLGDPDFRRGLGIEIEQGALVLTHPLNEVVVALTKVVEDLARREITVNSIKLKSDRTDYLNQIREYLPESEPLDTPIDIFNTGHKSNAKNSTGINADKKPNRRKNLAGSLERKTLIPKTCVIPIYIHKVNDLFKELRHIPVDAYPIASASLLRAFIDTTTLEYVEKFNLTVKRNPAGQMELKARIEESIRHFSSQPENREAGAIAKNQLLQNSGAIHIDSLHLNLHSRYSHPLPDNLRLGWNMIEPFMKGVWAKLQAIKEA